MLGNPANSQNDYGRDPAKPAPVGDEVSQSTHSAQFYEGDACLLEPMDRLIGPALEAGEGAVVIATEAHRRGLAERLTNRGLSVSTLLAEGRFVSLDAAETVSKLMVDGRPEKIRFAEVVGAAVAGAAVGEPLRRVRVFGEMAAVLYLEGNREAAIALEELWNDLATELRFSLVCAYPTAAFRGIGHREPFLQICSAHSHIALLQGYAALATPAEQLWAIGDLHQKAEGLKARIGAATEAESRLAAIVESTDDAIIGKTLEGLVTSWNPAAERLFGYTAEEMIGQPIARLIPPERQDDFERILKTIRRGERVTHFETERIRKDGSRVHVSLTVSPIKNANGEIVGASKIARNVSDRKRAEVEREELLRIAERARADAETASRGKDEFLAMLGHELRNPLSAIRNALVTAQLDPSRRNRAHQLACRQADQLARLVDDLLDVARFTQGKLSLRKQQVVFASVIEQALDTARPLIEERAHKLTVSLPASDVKVEVDPMRLEQVIVNVISNAAKYTEPGGRIDIAAEAENGEVVLRVRDSGVGIRPDMLGRVFDLFAQAGRTEDRKQEGLGIGLTVVRQLVELHGGRVEAHSEGLGKGTEIVVRLPILPTTLDAAVGISQGEVITYRGPARVLLVEDNWDVAESMVGLLEVLGHRVRATSDGLSALDVASVNPPDVMLIDIGLPGMDGYEVARRVRQDPKLRRIVLVALTGYGREEDKREAAAAGFDHHLTKPIEIDKLQELVALLSRTDAKSGARTV
jgi:PAS domain S-box-containing protein